MSNLWFKCAICKCIWSFYRLLDYIFHHRFFNVFCRVPKWEWQHSASHSHPSWSPHRRQKDIQEFWVRGVGQTFPYHVVLYHEQNFIETDSKSINYIELKKWEHRRNLSYPLSISLIFLVNTIWKTPHWVTDHKSVRPHSFLRTH